MTALLTACGEVDELTDSQLVGNCRHSALNLPGVRGELMELAVRRDDDGTAAVSLTDATTGERFACDIALDSGDVLHVRSNT